MDLSLPFDPKATPDLLDDAAARARMYVAGVGERRVWPDEDALEVLRSMSRIVPEHPGDPHQVLAELDRVGSPATVTTTGPRYFGFVNGGVLPAALAASWLAHSWDQNTAMASMSPAATHFDELALEWVVDLLGLPEGTGGAFVTGATMASVSGLLAGRNSVLSKVGWDVDGDGLIGAPPVTVVVGDEAHSSLFKALSMVGLGRRNVVRLPVDEQGAVKTAGLPELSGPALVCLQAGNVNSGASDPFEPLIEWAHAADAWVHVDGAFGLWAAASPAKRAQVAGVQAADSWATDAHKWLNAPYDAGIVLVADPSALAGAFTQTASYLPPTGHRDPLAYSPESSQRARGVESWAAIASLGRSGVADLVDRTCALAQRSADGFRAGGLTVANDVVLNQVVIGFGDRTADVLGAVQDLGVCWLGPTVWKGAPAARFSVSCWSTTEADIDASVAAIVQAARDLN